MTQRRAVTRNKYGAKAVCACGHLREWHWMRATMPPKPGRCKDMDCPCTDYRKRYDSMAEAERGAELEALEQDGKIQHLQQQVRFELHAADNDPGRPAADCEPRTVGFYVADFAYQDCRTGAQVVEDVKGVRTSLYRWKAAHMLAEYGIEIREIEA